jgi:hypothetical protein
VAIHTNQNRDYLSSDTVVWQFLQDSAPAGISQGRGAFLAITHQILADESFLQLINQSVKPLP